MKRSAMEYLTYVLWYPINEKLMSKKSMASEIRGSLFAASDFDITFSLKKKMIIIQP